MQRAAAGSFGHSRGPSRRGLKTGLKQDIGGVSDLFDQRGGVGRLFSLIRVHPCPSVVKSFDRI